MVISPLGLRICTARNASMASGGSSSSSLGVSRETCSSGWKAAPAGANEGPAGETCVPGPGSGYTGAPEPGETGWADTGTADPGPADTGLADTGLADTGLADTGLVDGGPADARPADMGLAAV